MPVLCGTIGPNGPTIELLIGVNSAARRNCVNRENRSAC